MLSEGHNVLERDLRGPVGSQDRLLLLWGRGVEVEKQKALECSDLSVGETHKDEPRAGEGAGNQV